MGKSPFTETYFNCKVFCRGLNKTAQNYNLFKIPKMAAKNNCHYQSLDGTIVKKNGCHRGRLFRPNPTL